MVDWLGSRGRSDLFSPLLPPGSDDDTAATSDSTPNDSPRDPRDSLAAAVRDLSRGSTPRDSSAADKARKRWRWLERIRSRTPNTSRRADGASVADEAASRDGEAMEGGRAIDEGEDADVGREADEDGGREVSRREKMINGAMLTAGVVALVGSEGAALYLITLWDTLSTVMRVCVAVTSVWLHSAMYIMIFQFIIGGEEATRQAASDVPSANGQFLEVGALTMPRARIRFGIWGVAGTSVPPEVSIQ